MRAANAYTAAVSWCVTRCNGAVDLIDREAWDVYVGGTAIGRRRVVDQPTVPNQPTVAIGDLDGRLRRLLSKRWKTFSTDWAADTLLEVLRPLAPSGTRSRSRS